MEIRVLEVEVDARNKAIFIAYALRFCTTLLIYSILGACGLCVCNLESEELLANDPLPPKK